MEGMLIGTLLRKIFDILSTDPKSGEEMAYMCPIDIQVVWRIPAMSN